MVPKSEVLQINLNLVQGLFAMWLFIYLFIHLFIYLFIYLFIKFLSIIFFFANFLSKPEVVQIE